MKLSKNLSLNEVIKSNTAERKGIDNNPNETHLANLKYLAEQVFQPIREHFGVPIYISSGYRSPALNEAIGGSPRSFHSHGMALDLDQDGRNKGVSNADVFYFIKENLQDKIDQNFDNVEILSIDVGRNVNENTINVSINYKIPNTGINDELILNFN